jgi:hypothetical protein
MFCCRYTYLRFEKGVRNNTPPACPLAGLVPGADRLPQRPDSPASVEKHGSAVALRRGNGRQRLFVHRMATTGSCVGGRWPCRRIVRGAGLVVRGGVAVFATVYREIQGRLFGDVCLVFLFLCAGTVITASPQYQQVVAASLQFLLLTI